MPKRLFNIQYDEGVSLRKINDNLDLNFHEGYLHGIIFFRGGRLLVPISYYDFEGRCDFTLSGRSYKCSSFITYDSRLVLDKKCANVRVNKIDRTSLIYVAIRISQKPMTLCRAVHRNRTRKSH